MDVFFDIPGGSSFSIQVDYDDTVKGIKEKIQKHQNIPISKQALFFNCELLQDNGDVWKYKIHENSRIELHIAEDSKVQLNIKIPYANMHFQLEMDKNETVLKLKQKIQELESSVPINRLVLHVKGTELQDNQFLRDCNVLNDNVIEMSIRQPEPKPMVTPAIGVGGSNTIIVVVLSKCGEKSRYVEINPSDNVGDLRKQLQRFRQIFQFPPEGYFFIYKNNIMQEDRSFHWHCVSHGDVIQIFNGRPANRSFTL